MIAFLRIRMRRLHRHKPRCRFVLIVAGILTLPVHGYEDKRPTTDEVLSVWKARDRRAHSARIVWDVKQVYRKDALTELLADKSLTTRPHPATDIVLDGRCCVTIDSRWMRYDYDGHEWSLYDYKIMPKRQQSIYDGETYHKLSHSDDPSKPSSAVIRSLKGGSEYSDRCNLPVWLTVRSEQAVNHRFPLLQHVVTDRVVRVADRPCRIFERKTRESHEESLLYLDEERDYQLVRWLVSRGGVLQAKLDITYEPKPGFGWVPKSWETVAFNRNGKFMTSFSCKVREFEINPVINSDVFTFSPPPGTRLADLTGEHEKETVIQSDGTPGRMIVTEGKIVSYDELARISSTTRRPWKAAIGILLGIMNIVAALALLFGRRQNKFNVSNV